MAEYASFKLSHKWVKKVLTAKFDPIFSGNYLLKHSYR
jgi:hypothetical protein